MTYDEIVAKVQYDGETGTFEWMSGPNVGMRADHQTRSGNGYPYYRVKIKRKFYKAHILAVYIMTGAWPATIVDHKNGNALDNRWDNLRLATAHENQRNTKRRKDSKSGIKGVTRSRNKFKARVTIDGKRVDLGEYATPEEAHFVYQKAAIQHYGEFARFV